MQTIAIASLGVFVLFSNSALYSVGTFQYSESPSPPGNFQNAKDENNVMFEGFEEILKLC